MIHLLPCDRPDITDRRDVMRLVNVFYDRVRSDDLLGPIFDDVARVNWAEHLPRMYDFWDTVLFGTATFKGAPLEVHRSLAGLTPLTSREFDRWLSLFHSTVDDLFSGSMAEETKGRATRIAATLQHYIAGDQVPHPLTISKSPWRVRGSVATPIQADERL